MSTTTPPAGGNAGPLTGVRVLDFGRFIAGPFCAALLAEFGADVIRVERPEGAEDRFLMPVTDDGTGALYLQMNRNKRSLALDVTSDEGRAIVRRLLANTDVVVANLPPTTLRKMGLDYATLSAIKPDIILVNLSAYGQEGPWSTRPGFDSIGQVMCGGVYLSGEDGKPRRTQVNWVDHATATHAAFGTLLALMERNLSGRGQEVTGALLNTALSAHAQPLVEQHLIASDRQPAGNRGIFTNPGDLFEARDGWLVLQAVGNPLFRRLAKLIDEPQWLEDPRFQDDEGRGAHGEELCERIAAWCAERTLDEALDALAEARIPSAPVLSPAQSLAHPQVQATGMLQPMTIPGLDKEALLATAPVNLSRTPGSLRRPPPRLGEHNEEILAELERSEQAG
ncbi:putative isomerase [Alcanivorax xiamenensis]|uniref:Isomerase n=1 Tax=Alcanivorax xiamenensis TaxID=1177156 RepID=A0ABQ6Y3B4_9GAMM|nr:MULTISPECIES: CoA transferase [Alcanivorax]KAF0803110.1 putative isomerase [Alcanivorax xiamenensis]